MLGGFVGLALGTMRLPVLLLLGFDTTIAAGTNIAVSTASAATGAVRHFRDGRVDTNVVLLVGVPSMAGAFAGGLASGNVPDSLLLLAVGVLVFWQGVELIARVRPRMQSEHPASDSRSLCDSGRRASDRRGRRAAGAGVGMAVGLLGGAVGLILGSLRLPALIRVLEMQPRTAAGTNLAIGFLMGSVGWTGHVFQGQVDYHTWPLWVRLPWWAATLERASPEG